MDLLFHVNITLQVNYLSNNLNLKKMDYCSLVRLIN